MQPREPEHFVRATGRGSSVLQPLSWLAPISPGARSRATSVGSSTPASWSASVSPVLEVFNLLHAAQGAGGRSRPRVPPGGRAPQSKALPVALRSVASRRDFFPPLSLAMNGFCCKL